MPYALSLGRASCRRTPELPVYSHKQAQIEEILPLLKPLAVTQGFAYADDVRCQPRRVYAKNVTNPSLL
jgi:hypothetical protein